MSKVIGPFEFGDWVTLRMLRSHINSMSTVDNSTGVYTDMVQDNLEVYNCILNRYIPRSNSTPVLQ